MMTGARPHRQSPPGRGESGIALATVLVIVVVVAILTVTVSMSVQGSAQRSAARSEQVRLQPVIDSAARAYQRGLESGVINERTDYAMTEGAAREVVPETDVVVRADDPSVHSDYREYKSTYGVHQRMGSDNADVRVDPFELAPPAENNEWFAVRIDTPGKSTSSFWQILRVDMSTAYEPGAKMAVYVRAWEGSSNGRVTRDRVARLEFGAERFSDFQMLTNSSIVFGDGSLIDGPVHSNGTATTPGVDPGNDEDIAIAAKGEVICSSGTAGYPVTTGTGAIKIDNCNIAERTGDFIDFGRVTSTFEAIARNCDLSGSDSVVCVDADPDGHEVQLDEHVPFGDEPDDITNHVRYADVARDANVSGRTG